MPRLSNSLILQAYNASELLPLVLRGARTLDLARNELRWLREHVQNLKSSSSDQTHQRLLKLCQRRSRGEPLQYILGSQPFGELDIKCRPGVLIPRPETESYTTYLADLANSNRLVRKAPKSECDDPRFKALSPHLRILDLCSGSGCISLLLYSLLSTKFPKLRIFGLDISKQAVSLAKYNLSRNVKAGHIPKLAIADTPSHPPQVQFGIADILQSFPKNIGQFDIIISNPPYISRDEFNTQTTRSVRNYEPKLALVPIQKSQDVFYERLIRLHQVHLSQVLAMEVGDAAQAIRVAEMAFEMNNTSYQHTPRVTNRVEIWRDDPGQDAAEEVRVVAGKEIRFRGRGKIRAVVLFREETDRNSVYQAILNKNVVERLDEPDVVQVSKKEFVKGRRAEARIRRKKARHEKINSDQRKRRLGLLTDDDLERLKENTKTPGKLIPGRFGRSSWA
ncbi:S-adenosyl-L-methionine-dependent methyltransferase [Rhexocercosporidium sp. MPI-PUGE-AT-0058]|nr:S-adenosyl-L-methionine-dependent methyltransferase [Rhexocercosporidium sp. MPI-PUGE-AT-0058]